VDEEAQHAAIQIFCKVILLHQAHYKTKKSMFICPPNRIML